MADDLIVGRCAPGVRIFVLDADIADFDLGRLEAAIQSALQPLAPTAVRRAVSVVVRGASGEPSRVEVAIEAADAAFDAAEDRVLDRRVTGGPQRITVDPDLCGGRPCLRG